MKLLRTLMLAALALGLAPSLPAAEDRLSFTGQPGPAHGRKVVLISGDEEYRSEESLPMLAKILSQRHGFDCTVLFAIDPVTGLIDPNLQTNIPGLESLAQADLLIIATRFRRLPPDQLRFIADYLRSGRPVVGLRTATHAFTGDAVTDGIIWKDFGLNVLGETWINHHGRHMVEGTRGVIESSNAGHPILRGVTDVFGPSDVYGIKNLGSDATILLRGQVTTSLHADSSPVEGPKNNPLMPLAWVRGYQVPAGKAGLAFCTTLGASVDLLSEDLRRLIVNAALHLVGLEVPARASVDFVDPFDPTFYGFVRDPAAFPGRGLRPADFGLGRATAPLPFVKAPEGYHRAGTR